MKDQKKGNPEDGEEDYYKPTVSMTGGQRKSQPHGRDPRDPRTQARGGKKTVPKPIEEFSEEWV